MQPGTHIRIYKCSLAILKCKKVSELRPQFILPQFLKSSFTLIERIHCHRKMRNPTCQEHIYPPGWSQVTEVGVPFRKNGYYLCWRESSRVSLQIKFMDTKGPASCATSWTSLSSPTAWVISIALTGRHPSLETCRVALQIINGYY